MARIKIKFFKSAKFVSLVFSVFYMAAIFCISIKQYAYTSIYRRIFNNLAHIPAYTILILLFFNFFRVIIRHNYFTNLLISGILAIMFGLLMELIQARVPGRETSVMDLFLNLIGIFIGCYVIFKLKHTKS